MLRLDRLRALVDVYPGVDREDEMVAAFDYTLHGKGGAAPSIDTAMHGLVDAAHVDHLHPDSGIAVATAADGEELTAKAFGDGRVGAVASPRLPARPGHRRDQARQPRSDRRDPRRPRHHRVGRHLRRGRSELALDHRDGRGLHRGEQAAAPVRRRPRRLRPLDPSEERRAKAAALAPHLRAIASTDRAQVGHFTDDGGRARLPGQLRASASCRARHELPRPFPAHQGQAARARPAGSTAIRRGLGCTARRTARGLPGRLHRLLRAGCR